MERFIATNATPQKKEAPKKEGPETPPDSPLLDLTDVATKKLVRSAKKRGYVTHDQINSVLPPEEVNSEQIEDILAMFSGSPGMEGGSAEPYDVVMFGPAGRRTYMRFVGDRAL